MKFKYKENVLEISGVKFVFLIFDLSQSQEKYTIKNESA
jgi:hypothetical protein